MATPPPALPATACSAVSRALDEPHAGTAATAATWLCVEQPGPWGRDAARESHLDAGLAAELAERAAGTGVRVLLIRRPGPHPDRHRPVPRRVYLAHTAPGRSFLRRDTFADPKQLLDLDFAAAGAGEAGAFGERVTSPMLLVCTNGRRDVCCAVLGRPVAVDLAATHGEAVWECSHIGGHRFAATGLLLPTGYAYGGLDLPRARALLSETTVVTDRCRGRSTWHPAGQAAEIAVRELTHTTHPDVLRVRDPERDDDGHWRVQVGHVDGRGWRVTVAPRTLTPDRAASCGATPGPVTAHVVIRID
ncbi:sucrase ferredoxin [Actinokineospora sp. NBRC 105648]|uniref:sucrase ferredoxin n=1 Tax=Actinokineospora sp. NBRC 105648 TaxID=3032206 RepID=UPI00255605F6|nr:sucrase ferredoxin [Actinokineospora sp. NBRC 105648]